ncbi:beta strand repeat-containing protein [Nostoc sp.]|uniref:beta strand repeat-containing protein n=1 Tax=Nostoc sp. TaxID=1180 RepID=UPI002FFAADD8
MMANSVFNLSNLNGTNGFAINGSKALDGSGNSVSSAGDINGDGIADLIIGAAYADPNGSWSGQSYVVFGRKGGFDAQLNLSTLNGTNGFAINGIKADDLSGWSVSSAGDINDDGIADLIIGAHAADPNGSESGQSYVVFGSKGGFDAQLNLSTLNGTNGFAINGINTGDDSGWSVSSAGDINDDGIADLIIGAYGAEPNGSESGQSYVVFGRKGGFDAQLNLSTLNGTNGFAIDGINNKKYSGWSVSSAGDINGDGIADLIIGARNGAEFHGQSYVVFGSKGGFGAKLNLSTLNGTNGFAINGIKADENSGWSVSSAGDINSDGIADLIIGAPYASPASPNDYKSGQSYVVFGSKGGFGAKLNLSTLNGTNGFAINGIKAYDLSGVVSSAGDINGDGIADLIIGAPAANPNGSDSGQSYVVFGRKGGFDAQLNLSTLNGTNGFAINGINPPDNLGSSVSSAGDINGDGIADLIIAAPNGAEFHGQSYVLFGNRAPVLDLNGNSSGIYFSTTFSGTPVSILDRNFTLSDNNTTLAGATITIANLLNGAAESLSATAIGNITTTYNATTGTLTLSGTDTIANYRQVLSSLTYNNTAASVNTSDRFIQFVVNDGQGFSNTSTVANTTLSFNLKLTGTNCADILTGTSGNNIIKGLAGNDTLTGNGGQDKFIFRPSDGIDTITDFDGVGKGSNPSAAVIAQVDTLQFRGSGLTAQNLQLTPNGNNLEVTFENVANTKVTLQNFKLENLDNLPTSGARPAIGNILFDGQTSIADSFDVIDANSTQTSIFNKNTVTFLNELNNNIAGFDNSNDVINGQGGNDIINGNSGNDLLRGKEGDDILIGGEGNDTLVGGVGNNILIAGVGADRFLYNTDAAFAATAVGVDAISDFKHYQGDKIILDKTTFNAIASVAGNGFSNASDFKITSSAATSTAKIVYDIVSGQLFYNQNGSAAGFGSGGLFATLTGAPTLTASDFIIQA